MNSESTELPSGINEFSNKIILADKPLDFTSADIVRIFKRNFSIKKIGHSGTLDPRATGLLILCTDQKTKTINEIIEYDKEYEGVIRIGAVTKSFDTETEEENIIEKFDVTDEQIENVRKTFLGVTEQIPPMYSAIKHKGKPLYKLARKGREIKREPRKITVTDFEIKRMSETEIYFRIRSSKGTYIRTIANDFGERLGIGGYLKTLRRLRVGKYDLEGMEDETNGIRYRLL
ncbi:MAG: tRNA pseudouridine(55) synthase TruB [Ignavibacteria bacterium]